MTPEVIVDAARAAGIDLRVVGGRIACRPRPSPLLRNLISEHRLELLKHLADHELRALPLASDAEVDPRATAVPAERRRYLLETPHGGLMVVPDRDDLNRASAAVAVGNACGGRGDNIPMLDRASLANALDRGPGNLLDALPYLAVFCGATIDAGSPPPWAAPDVQQATLAAREVARARRGHST